MSTYQSVPARPCTMCGKPMPRRPTERPCEYLARKTCGRKCSSAKAHKDRPKVVLAERNCLGCGEIMHRKPGEVPAQYLRRRYHSKQCFGLALSRKPARRAPVLAAPTVRPLHFETIEEFLARGGRVTVIPTPADDLSRVGIPVMPRRH